MQWLFLHLQDKVLLSIWNSMWFACPAAGNAWGITGRPNSPPKMLSNTHVDVQVVPPHWPAYSRRCPQHLCGCPKSVHGNTCNDVQDSLQRSCAAHPLTWSQLISRGGLGSCWSSQAPRAECTHAQPWYQATPQHQLPSRVDIRFRTRKSLHWPCI